MSWDIRPGCRRFKSKTSRQDCVENIPRAIQSVACQLESLASHLTSCTISTCTKDGREQPTSARMNPGSPGFSDDSPRTNTTVARQLLQRSHLHPILRFLLSQPSLPLLTSAPTLSTDGLPRIYHCLVPTEVTPGVQIDGRRENRVI